MKEKILSIKGGEFKEWYNSLSLNEKKEYKETIIRMKESNAKYSLRKLSEKIIHLVLESEDDYEATYVVEDKIKEYLKK